MNIKSRARCAWGLPFLIAFGMALGSFIGFVVAADDALERDPVGSVGALAMFINLVAGFVVSGITVLVAKAISLSPPDRFALRLVLSGLGGALTGAIGWVARDDFTGALGLVLLVIIPVALSLPWGKASNPSGSPTL